MLFDMFKKRRDPHMQDYPAITAKATEAPKVALADGGPKQEKIKVLWYSDFLRQTGFGNVAEAIMSRLLATGKYEFEVVGINHWGEPYNVPGSRYHHLRNVPVWPAYMGGDSSPFGYERLQKLIETRHFDVLFVLQDTFNLTRMKEVIEKARAKKKFAYVFYFPVDGDLHQEWVTDGVDVADFPVAYTGFGKQKVAEVNELSAQRLRVIYHGVDTNTFMPFDTKAERDHYRQTRWEVDDETFVVGTVNRNQPRKDLPRLMLAYNRFREKYPDIKKAMLYMHCIHKDQAGFDLAQVAKHYVNPKFHAELSFPDPGMMNQFGYPISEVRKVYAACDVMTSTTLGEGWGLMATEAMACGTPVAIPDNTSAPEIVGPNQERGYLVASGREKVFLRNDNDQARPLTDIEHLADTLYHIATNKKDAQRKAKQALRWVQSHTWEHKALEWDEVFQTAYSYAKQTRQQ